MSIYFFSFLTNQLNIMLRINTLKSPLTSRNVTKILNKTQYTAYTSSCCHSKKKEAETKAPVTSLRFWSDPLTWQRTRVNTLR